MNALVDSAKVAMDSQYAVRTLTTWLLEQERKGNIDNELGVVIASIALACKQIATLVNRSGISNLTGESPAAAVLPPQATTCAIAGLDRGCPWMRRRAALAGLAGAANVQGEDQKKLDVISNEVFKNCLRSSGRTGVLASEEEDLPVPVLVEETYSGKYVVVFDPLDGSSNIDAGISVGSIWGVYSESEG